ncbi:MAG: metallophosphoesterase [Betaproteobacteria bacterium]|nr:metallophosphoesterase [Betaproteobacteria bacterium]
MKRAIQNFLSVLLSSAAMISVASANSRTNPASTRLCFISDFNGSYGSISMPSSVHAGVSQLTKLNCGLVIGAGDLVAGQDPSLTESHLRSMWDEFQRAVLMPLDLAGVPMLTALGNHDASAARGSSGGYIYQRERNAAAEVWMKRLMGSVSGAVEWLSQEEYPFFYAVRFGTTALVFIDGSSATEVRRKRVWLENQLSTIASHPSISTRIVVGHLPLVAVARGRDRAGEVLADSRELYELFDRNKVDFYVSGHHHAFFPGRVPEWSRVHGTVQIALGAVGDGPRRLLGEHAVSPQQSISFLDINESMSVMESRFSLQTLSPYSGETLSPRELPGGLPSLDGTGKPIWLKRFDFNSIFPFP